MNAKDYLTLPYNLIIRYINDESGSYYHASIFEFDGCQSTGDTFDEAYDGLIEAMEGWIKTKLENNLPIPKPLNNPK